MTSFDFTGAFQGLNQAVDEASRQKRLDDATAARLKFFDRLGTSTPADDSSTPSPQGSILAPLSGGQSASAAPTPATPASTPAAPTASGGSPSSPLPSIAAVQGAPGGTGVGQMLNDVNDRFGLPKGYLPTTAGLESNWNAAAVNKGSGAAGPFQFTKGTAAQYGLSNPHDWAESTLAAAQLASDNKRTLVNALGRDPTAGELYLAHQQGAGGASKLLANPNARAGDVVGNAAVRSNGGDPNMPAAMFASKWTSKFPGQQQTASAAPAPTFATGQTAAGAPVNIDADGNALGPDGRPTTVAAATPDPSQLPIPAFARADDTTMGSTPAQQAITAMAGRQTQPAPSPYGSLAPVAGPTPAVDGQQPSGVTDAPALAFQGSTAFSGTGQGQANAPAVRPVPFPGSNDAPHIGSSDTRPNGSLPNGAQIYGSVPLNINGKMLTRDQAENTEDLDHTDYDNAAAKLGMTPTPYVEGGQAAAAQPASASVPQPSAAGVAGPAVAGSTPAPSAGPTYQSPALAAASGVAGAKRTVIPRDAIRILLANPDTSADGMKLWEQSVTGKNYDIKEAKDGSWSRWDPSTGSFTQLTGPKSEGYTLASNTKRFDGNNNLVAVNNETPEEKAAKAQLVHVPRLDGTFQDAWVQPGQDPNKGTLIGAPYTKPQAGKSDPVTATAQRRQAIVAQGFDPTTPENQAYIAYGQAPAKASMTGPEAKIFNDAYDKLQGAQETLAQLQEAQKLVTQGINTGVLGGLKNAVNYGTNGLIGDSDQRARTLGFNDYIKNAQSSAARTAVGGRVTNYEEQLFQKMNPDSSQSPEQLQMNLQRLIDANQQKLTDFGSRVEQMKAGQFFKTGGGPTGAKPQSQGGNYQPASTAADALAQGRAAIAAGVDPTAVRSRLQQHGINPAGL